MKLTIVKFLVFLSLKVHKFLGVGEISSQMQVIINIDFILELN
jgi:hypothetical protein